MAKQEKPVTKVAPIREEKPPDPRMTMEEASQALVEMSKKSRRPSTNVVPKVRKPSFSEKLKDTLFGGDANNVGNYIIWDVLIPAAKETIQDMVTKGIDMWLFGGQGRANTRTRGRSGTSGVVNYGNYYRSNTRRDPRDDHRMVRSPGVGRRVDNVVFDYEEDAGEVLEVLIELNDLYGQVTVADFYEAANLPNYSEYTDNSVGWRNIHRTKIARTRDGWQLMLPQPQLLD